MTPMSLTNEELLTELKGRLRQTSDQRKALEYLRLEDEVRDLSAQLQKSEKGKSQFLSNIRNEINNPITSILGLSASVVSMSTGEKVKRMSNLIYQQAFELDFQMRNIIVAAEIEMGEINPLGSNVDVVTLIEEQVAYLRPKIEQSSVFIKLGLPEALKFNTDAYLIQIICANLLTNAIEYSGLNKMVIVEADECDGNLVIDVKDFGIGVAPEKQKMIFDRFQQADTGATKSHPGHGLGLTIVKELTEQLQGKLVLRSMPGEGTQVQVVIPALKLNQASESVSVFGNEVLFTSEVEI